MFKLSNFQNKTINVLLVVLVLFFVGKTLASLKEVKYLGSGIAPANVISFEGRGEVFAVPDIANISFSFREKGKTQKEAQDKVSLKSSNTIDSLKKAGISERDIKTLSYNSYPEYEYAPPCFSHPCPPQKPPKIIGFEVNQNISVKVRKTEEVGKIIDILAKLEVSDISGPNFEIDEVEKVQAEARKKAIDDAKAKAELLAKDLGVRLVRIVNFSEGGVMPVYGRAEFKAFSTDLAAPLPEIPVGENKIVSNVTITYEIK